MASDRGPGGVQRGAGGDEAHRGSGDGRGRVAEVADALLAGAEHHVDRSRGRRSAREGREGRARERLGAGGEAEAHESRAEVHVSTDGVCVVLEERQKCPGR